MESRRTLIVLGCWACLFSACTDRSDPTPELVPLPAAEVFNWGGQPIAVSPPPEGWRREKEQSGGLRGVRFVKSGSIGEEIRVAEHFSLDERDRCARLTDLLSDLDNLDPREFALRIQRGKLWAEPPINYREETLANLANARLDDARAAFFDGRTVEARTAVSEAFGHALEIRYSLDDVVERVMFSPTSYSPFGTVEVSDPVRVSLAGEAGVTVDFTLDSTDRGVLFSGRQVYLTKNNRLFLISFLGLPENLPLFEQILETVSFPAGQCAH